jgi:predicted RecA/RadA family phage recombinase
MNNTVCDGNIIEYTNSTGSKINSGAVVVMGKFCGVAVADIPNGATGAVAVEGVFDLPKKTTTDTMAVGDALSYNSGVVKVAGSTGITIGKDVIVGYAVQASSSASTTVRAKLAH